MVVFRNIGSERETETRAEKRERVRGGGRRVMSEKIAREEGSLMIDALVSFLPLMHSHAHCIITNVKLKRKAVYKCFTC